jgi:hypothetical protein
VFHRTQEIRAYPFLRILDLTLRDPYPLARQVHAIQFFRPRKQSGITTAPDVGDNPAGDALGLDVATSARGEQPLFNRAG